MVFISHSENFEDVILYRVFRDLNYGYYIDVGARDPNSGSITYAFYERGWIGINVEPDPILINKLKIYRPYDVNLEIITGDLNEEKQYYELTGSGLYTVNESLAKDQAIKGGYEITEKSAMMCTLNYILERYSLPEIHFIKVHFEGAEELVLKGFDLFRFRPWVIIVKTMFQSEINVEWEKQLFGYNYRKVFFDGINRYYLASEKCFYLNAFNAPPNITDNFKTAREYNLINQTLILKAETEEKYPSKRKIGLFLTVIKSGISKIIRNIKGKSENVKLLIKKGVKCIYKCMVHFLLFHPWLKEKMYTILIKCPKLLSLFTKLKMKPNKNYPFYIYKNEIVIEDLSKRARSIYKKLLDGNGSGCLKW